MTSIRELSDKELDEQIQRCQEQMDNIDCSIGDCNCAKAELRVAQIEKKRRGKQWEI